MKQSDCTDLVPANDNGPDERELDLFTFPGQISGVDPDIETVAIIGRFTDDGVEILDVIEVRR